MVHSGRFPVATRNVDNVVAGFVAIMESLLRVHGAHSKFTVIYDRQNFSYRQNWDRELLTKIAEVAQNNYPEVLKTCLIYPTNLVMKGLWRIMRVFLDVRVRRKIAFLNRTDELLEYVSKESLSTEFGGENAESFDHAKFVKSLTPVVGDAWSKSETGESDSDEIEKGTAVPIVTAHTGRIHRPRRVF